MMANTSAIRQQAARNRYQLPYPTTEQEQPKTKQTKRKKNEKKKEENSSYLVRKQTGECSGKNVRRMDY